MMGAAIGLVIGAALGSQRLTVWSIVPAGLLVTGCATWSYIAPFNWASSLARAYALSQAGPWPVSRCAPRPTSPLCKAARETRSIRG
jgi:hypothetical protein